MDGSESVHCLFGHTGWMDMAKDLGLHFSVCCKFLCVGWGGWFDGASQPGTASDSDKKKYGNIWLSDSVLLDPDFGKLYQSTPCALHTKRPLPAHIHAVAGRQKGSKSAAASTETTLKGCCASPSTRF
eukprot:1158066-Pelagomonas_calceolata.AAC.8